MRAVRRKRMAFMPWTMAKAWAENNRKDGLPTSSGFPRPRGSAILPAMNAFLSAVMILWIFGMVIYLTKDM